MATPAEIAISILDEIDALTGTDKSNRNKVWEAICEGAHNYWHVGAQGTFIALDDTLFAGPADLDLVQYDNVSSKWVDKSLTEIFGALGDANPWRHNRYTDGEAVSAMGAKGDANPLHHDKYTDGEAVSAMGAKGDANPLHHDKYTDGDARAAIGNIFGSDGHADADIDMDTNQIKDMGDPTADQDAVTKKWAEDNLGGGVGGGVNALLYLGL
jgi:hypothetical protein